MLKYAICNLKVIHCCFMFHLYTFTTLILVAAFTYSATELHAQDSDTIPRYRKFAPIGATWYGDNAKTTATRDTIVDGVVASYLEKDWLCISFCDNESIIDHYTSPEIVYDNGLGQVFYRIRDSFYLLYDFTVKVGDTVRTMARLEPANDESLVEVSVVVTDVDTIEVDGTPLHSYRTSMQDLPYGYLFNGWVHEVLGRDGPMLPFNGVYEDAGFFSPNPDCYKDSILYIRKSGTACDLLTSARKANVGASSIKITPNPARDFIGIANVPANLRLTLLTAKGERLLDISTKGFDVSNLSPGLYFIVGVTDTRIFSQRFIKL